MEMNENNHPPAVDQAYQQPAMYEGSTVTGNASNRAITTAVDAVENPAAENVTVDEYLTQLRAAKKDKAQKDVLFGALWCVGGIVATAAQIGYIFWGAIVFGGIQFFRGLANLKGDD